MKKLLVVALFAFEAGCASLGLGSSRENLIADIYAAQKAACMKQEWAIARRAGATEAEVRRDLTMVRITCNATLEALASAAGVDPEEDEIVPEPEDGGISAPDVADAGLDNGGSNG